MPKLFFTNTQQTFEIPEGTELLSAYKNNTDIPLKFGCTQGDCETCKILVVEGSEHLSPPTKQEKLTLNEKFPKEHRLACQCAILGDVQIIPITK